ncbi:MAG: hypothetical protein NT007_19015 [Candidatus Kapabacteria bacterium]|nr:hypothetical protein [Candidatus Kapabacteria bacterium]
MKSLINAVIAFILFLSIRASSSDFEIKPLGMDFNGLISSGKNIIAYSNNGNYLMTTNKGITWEQYSIDLNANIPLLLNQGDTIWGIIDKGYIIKSIDNGISWIQYPFHLDSGDKFIYLTLSDKFLYVRSINKILAFDKDINLKYTYSDTLINKTFIFGSQRYNYMRFFDNKLVVAVTQTKTTSNGEIIILSENLNKIGQIEFSKYIDTNKIQYKSFELTAILKYKGQNIFNLSGYPYTCDSNFENWNYLLKDTLKPVSDFGDLFLNSLYVHNDNLYIAYRKNNPAIKWQNCWTYNLGILKYDEVNDTLQYYNSKFLNNYYSGKNSFGYDNLSASCSNFNFFDDSLIIWFGKNKTIIQSRDFGKTWELVSHYSNSPAKQFINDSNFYCINPLTNDIYFTTNGGTSFKLPKLTDSLSYLYTFTNPTTFYCDSNGKGIFTGAKSIDNNKNNIGFTLDSGKTFNFISNKNFLQIMSAPDYSDITRVADKLIFSQNYKDSSRIYLMDFNNFNINLIKTDTSIFTHHISANNLEHFYMFDYMSSKKYPDLNFFEVRETIDSGQTWKQINSINKKLQIKQVYEYNKDSIFIVSINPNKIFLINMKSNQIDTLYSEDSKTFTYLQIMNLSDKFYIVGTNLLLENIEKNDLTKWQNSSWDYGTPNFFSLLFKGETAIASLKDSLRTINYYKLSLKTKTKKVDDQLIEVYTGKFFASPPYPIPSSSIIKAKLYWGDQFDISQADINIYDIKGDKIEGKLNITISNCQQYSCDLQWDCSSVQAGTYFIIINYRGKLEPIPVSVIK